MIQGIKMKTDRKDVDFSFIRRILLIIVGFFFLNILILDHFNSITTIGIVDKLSIYLFYILAFITIMISQIIIINPIINSRVILGFFGKELKKLEQHLSWEMAFSTGATFLFLLSLVYIIQLYLEFGGYFNEFNLLYVIILGGLALFQALSTLQADIDLKNMHTHLIQQINHEKELSYADFLDYISNFLKDDKSNSSYAIDNEIDPLKLEKSLSSPLSIYRVIPFQVLLQILSFILICIMVSYITGYYFLIDGVYIQNFRIARNVGAILSAILLFILAIILQLRKDTYITRFVTNPTYTIRPGQLDRIYIAFYPNELREIKIEIVETILEQTINLVLGLAVFSLLIGVFTQLLIYFGISDQIIEISFFFMLVAGMLSLLILITMIARNGARIWIKSIEVGLAQLDTKLKDSLGVTEDEFLQYIREAVKIVDSKNDI